jgi:uncharacterized protein YnzC (UPF0291/DUF896 family)
MWDERDQTRWNELAAKRRGVALTDAEQHEYDSLVRRLELDELRLLRPALRRIHRENIALQSARQTVEHELVRLEALLSERRVASQRLRAQVQALEQGYEAVLAQGSHAVGRRARVAAGSRE